MLPEDPIPAAAPRQLQRRAWDLVSLSPLSSLWDLQGVSVKVIIKHTWNALFDDNIFGRSAELGFYFIFALFPSLFTITSILGLAARSASKIYYALLVYLSVVIPHAAMQTVLDTFNQTTAKTTSGKLTFGLIAAIWSASVGFSAIQDTMNVVYRVKDTRSYLSARVAAIGMTIVLSLVFTAILASLLGADFLAKLAHLRIYHHFIATSVAVFFRIVGWIAACALLSFFFAVIYYFAPDVKVSHWHWLTPGSAIGIAGWFIASFGLRLYVFWFGNYSVTYGSLGAVIILLTWFYLTGLMLLLGAEINSEIEAAVAARRLLVNEQINPATTAASTSNAEPSSTPAA